MELRASWTVHDGIEASFRGLISGMLPPAGCVLAGRRSQAVWRVRGTDGSIIEWTLIGGNSCPVGNAYPWPIPSSIMEWTLRGASSGQRASLARAIHGARLTLTAQIGGYCQTLFDHDDGMIMI